MLQAPLGRTQQRVAQRRLFMPLWGPTILDEVQRTLPALIAHLNQPQARAERLLAVLEDAFPDAAVRPSAHLIPHRTIRAEDRQVVAAAIAGQARWIVTDHLRHFPASALRSPHGRAVTPDWFLIRLRRRHPAALESILIKQGEALHPPRTIWDIFLALQWSAPDAVAQVVSVHTPEG